MKFGLRFTISQECMPLETAEIIFKEIVRRLHLRGVYPSPTALNRAVHGRRSRNINGREAKWRREVMQAFGIPLQRPNGSVAARQQMTGQPR